jgi:hypothetical protein
MSRTINSVQTWVFPKLANVSLAVIAFLCVSIYNSVETLKTQQAVLMEKVLSLEKRADHLEGHSSTDGKASKNISVPLNLEAKKEEEVTLALLFKRIFNNNHKQQL